MAAYRIREVISRLLDSEATRILALEMACELSELERRACFGSEAARREGYRAGAAAAGAVGPR